MSDRAPMILGSKIPYGRGSLEGAEPPYVDGGLPHGRIGPAVPGDPGSWIIVPVDCPQDGRSYVRQNRVWVPEGSNLPVPPFISQAGGFIRANIAAPTTWIIVVGEAPGDNRLYARENQMWVALPAFIGEAPEDAFAYGRSAGIWVRVCNEMALNVPNATWAYGRRDGAWHEVPLELAPTDLDSVPFARIRIGPLTAWTRVPEEAPLDTTIRGRQNGQWVPINVNPGIPDSPIDGNVYGRGGTPVVDPTPRWQVVTPEAPTDGRLYGRIQQRWDVIPPSPVIPPDAPVDGNFHARRGRAVIDPVPLWEPIPIQEDAPVNDNLYARRNRIWTETVEEAPPNMVVHARRNHQWVPTIIGPEPPSDNQPYARVGDVWERLHGPWTTLQPAFPANWQASSEVRYRNIGRWQVEVVGSLNPAGLIPPLLTLLWAPLPAGSRPITEHHFLVYAIVTGVGPSYTAIRVTANTGQILIQALGGLGYQTGGPGEVSSVPGFHFIIALNTTNIVED